MTVVPNGTSPDLVARSRRPAGKTLVYTGTLLERFDVALTAGVLERLPGWRLDLYGQCRYPRCGEAPDPELEGLLAEFRDRVAWHGPVERSSSRRASTPAAFSCSRTDPSAPSPATR